MYQEQYGEYVNWLKGVKGSQLQGKANDDDLFNQM